MSTPSITASWSVEGQRLRRDLLWPILRRRSWEFFHEDGTAIEFEWGRDTLDHRVISEMATALLLGDDRDRALAHALLRGHDLRIGRCSFATDYILALWHNCRQYLEDDLAQWIVDSIKSTVRVYAKKDLQHHGFNDNHVTMATSSLILGGELVGDQWAVDQGRYNLLNFRDTLLRRGLIHETNDCYFWHTMYSTTAVARWAQDQEIRELAEKIEHRLWGECVAFYHPNLGRKIGPSARDYTGGRLHPAANNTALWAVFGDDIVVPAMPPLYLTPPDEEHRPFAWPGQTQGDDFWTVGFLARVTAQPYHVPDDLAEVMLHRQFPHWTSATNETGHMGEGYDVVGEGGGKAFHHMNAVQFPGQEHTFYSYMEEDWGMGTGDGRMIGGCPNNTWQLSYRKARPLANTPDQGHWWCSYVINHKTPVEDYTLQLVPPTVASGETGEFWFNSATRPMHISAWAESGRYAGMQHERTSLLLYRPRPLEAWNISALELTLCYPLMWRNAIEELWFDDQRVEEWIGASEDVCDIFVKDGPLYIAFKPLLSRPRTAPYRVKAEEKNGWGLVHLVSYEGESLALGEPELATIGSGFLCEVATEADFSSLDAFKAWFRQGQVVDDMFFHARQVRWHRPGLTLGLRYDVWNDHIIYRMVNGRSMPQPQYACSSIPNESLPWLTEDVSDWDHFTWAAAQAARPLGDHCQEPLKYEE
ncbi:MAG: hypothetical protein ACYC7E_02950 [Armatimonadota bacterium]